VVLVGGRSGERRLCVTVCSRRPSGRPGYTFFVPLVLVCPGPPVLPGPAHAARASRGRAYAQMCRRHKYCCIPATDVPTRGKRTAALASSVADGCRARQGKDLADKLKEIGDEFGSGLAELQEGALCTAASTGREHLLPVESLPCEQLTLPCHSPGVDSLDCCNDRSGSAQKLAHRFDLPDDAQARPAGQRNAVPQEKRLAGKKKTLAENGQFASQSTLAGVVPQPHSRGHVRQESAASQASTAAGHRDQYGLGILWLTRNSKLICAGFAPGSPAREAGVRSGDILKAVDSVGDMSQHYQGTCHPRLSN
jgi:hypothetical protein